MWSGIINYVTRGEVYRNLKVYVIHVEYKFCLRKYSKEKKYYIFIIRIITKFIDNTFFIVYMTLERKIGSSIKYKIDLYTFVCYGI